MPKHGREDISFDEIAEHFHLPIVEASQRLGVCNATIKRVCTEYGVPRWPYRKIMAGKSIDDIKREAALFLHQQATGGAAAAAVSGGAGGEMATGGAIIGEVSSGVGGYGEGDADFSHQKRRRMDDPFLQPGMSPATALFASPASALLSPSASSVAITPASASAAHHTSLLDPFSRGHSSAASHLPAWHQQQQPLSTPTDPSLLSAPPGSAAAALPSRGAAAAGGATAASHLGLTSPAAALRLSFSQQQQQQQAAARLPFPPAFRAAMQQSLLNPSSFPLPFPLPLARRVENAVRRGLDSWHRQFDEGFPEGGLNWGGNDWWEDEEEEEEWEEKAGVKLEEREEGKGSDSVVLSDVCRDEDQPAAQIGGNQHREVRDATVGEVDLETCSGVEAAARLESLLYAAARRASDGVKCSVVGGLGTAFNATADDKAVLKFVFGKYLPKEFS